MAQFVVKYHAVDVKITDQLAVTRVDQVFLNPNDWDLEGTYIFPLPSGAVATGLKLWIDGEPIEAKLLGADEARRIYEETVMSLRDPALLEYVGRGALQLRLFPIPARGERRIQLEYTQVLVSENGLVRYTYPLGTEKFSAQPIEQVSVKIELQDKAGLRLVYSPTHLVDILRDRDEHATVGYEAQNVLPDRDLTVYYSTGSDTGMHFLTFRDPGDLTDTDGYFIMLLAPGASQETRLLPKDVLLVLDRSGSMEGDKFKQAQEALRYILNHLNPEDRFYLQAFSTGVQTYASGLRSAEEAPQALNWVDRLGPGGSTDINRALLEASAAVSEDADPSRPLYLIFMTDGLPTTGEVGVQNILDNFLRAAPDKLRVFSFGVGYDVDTVLLDTLSSDHNGTSTYILPGEPLGEKLSAFYESINRPVMTNLELDWGSLPVYDLYPQPLPDMFAGSQITLAGRYRSGGEQDVILRGIIGTEAVEITYPRQEFTQDSRSGDPQLGVVARIWAARKIGDLLNQIRIKGPDEETIAQIVRMSIRFGIVTPYTSYLVDEPMPLGVESQRKIVEDAYGQIQATPMESSGQGAVERAAKEGELQSANSAPQDANTLPQDSSGVRRGNSISTVGGRTFINSQGIWTDTAYDPQKMSLVEVPFLSEPYFELARTRPDLSSALALGERVILVVDGKAYRITSAGNAAQPLELPTLVPTSVPTDTSAQAYPVPEVTPTLEKAENIASPTPRPDDAQNPMAGGCPLAVVLVAVALVVSMLVKRGG
jgi:Ca-activated chloride channel family protein